MNIIEVNNLNFSYGKNKILTDLTFDVPQGTFVAIAGPNGAGKTTLLSLLAGLLKPHSGSITFGSKNIGTYTIKQLAQKLALVRQESIPAFGFSVIQTVAMARTPHFSTAGFETENDMQIINDAMQATDTLKFSSRLLNQISGGERQRVFIARALAQDTPVLLLDEPTSFLDLHHQVEIYDLLKKMQTERNKTIIAITHNINLAAQYCDHALLLGPSQEYFAGLPNSIFSPQTIETTFGVKGFSTKIGVENAFIPLGKLAKDYPSLDI